jgi:transcription initiation factor TFIIB|uniref:Transcription factor TFIIB cyclin-like domain-containing protein n=1 Tax=viral metagenome TaxID=1070528 RepID=A0A6C0C104_9ZZZZ
MSTKKLKKKKLVNNTKKKKTKQNRNDLWNQFDCEINKKENLECLYSEQNIGEREKCEICNSQLYIGDDKYLTCTNGKCGIIYKDKMDQGAEWRYYGAADNQMRDPTRCGMPINPLLKESSYGCKVLCNSRSNYQMRKVRRYTEWQSMPYKEKSQYDEFQRIKEMSNIAGVPKIIVDDSLRYHKILSEMKTFRGDNRDGIIAASVYVACRVNNYPRTAKEIATIFHLENDAATKGCKNASHLINQNEKGLCSADKTHFHQTTPIAFIERYCTRLNINSELTKVCQFVAIRIQKNNLMDENAPQSTAAGTVYFISQSCNLNVSKKAVFNVSKISEVTINKCFKKLDKMKEQLIPGVILKKYTN